MLRRLQAQGLLVALMAISGCADTNPTSILLRVEAAEGLGAVDELRISVYGPNRLAHDRRLPSSGAPQIPGDVVILLEDATPVRILIRALAGNVPTGDRVAGEGVLRITPRLHQQTLAILTIQPGALDDSDGDGVPDAIDNCPTIENPQQGACTDDGGFVWGDGSVPEMGMDASREGTAPSVVTYRLTSQANLNLQTYLSGKGAPTDRDILVELPSGVIIHSSKAGSPAIASGDLSAYQKVTLEVAGEVQGAGGAANGGAGGNAINITSLMHITVKSGGAVRGGGGGGGKGGAGGACDNPNWMHVPHATKTYWKNYGTYNSPAGITLVLQSQVEIWRVAPMVREMLFTNQAGKYWKRGSLVSGSNSGTSDAWFDHHEATSINNGSGGAGGNGGRGQGYGQNASAGLAGAPGTHGRCGKGGAGGAGASWGAGGAKGAGGAAGYKHTTYNLSTSQAGSGGAGGGPGGEAVSCSGASIYYSNSGTVNGAVSCSLL